MAAFDLQRFVDAQADVYARALAELRAGAKTSHWMWFVFPQHRALGRSATALHYGLAGLDEAVAYWAHPLLGPRLAECCDALLALPPALSAHAILGSPDDLKLRSSMTLFRAAVPAEPRFDRMLGRFCAGQPDPHTLDLLLNGRAPLR
jgi:uncharacterized protein (DUF1810 family)